MNRMIIKSREHFGLLAAQYYQTGIGVEVGVERGNFSRLIASQWPGKLVCVDMWEQEEIQATALINLNPQGVKSPFSMIKSPSVDAAKLFGDETFDFVYIDANHDYEHCSQDIEAWFPKVRHGGLVAGHDYLDWTIDQGAPVNFGVKQAVTEFCTKHGYKLHLTTDDFWQGVPYQTWWFKKEIPRIIYFTWVSPDPLPERFQKYITAWKAYMPDYEIRQISLDNIVKSPFVMEAISRGLYSVAGHYGRCERLYATGGIYFDIDIEVVQRFDDLLDNEFFVGCEAPHRVNNAVIGSVPGHRFLAGCLLYMDTVVFHDPGPMGIEIETGPQMFTNLAKAWGWEERDVTQFLNGPVGINSSEITVYDSRYFYPYYFDKAYNPGCATPETYAIHHWAKTWIK
jgi:predicted O-methyltransferase YrrM